MGIPECVVKVMVKHGKPWVQVTASEADARMDPDDELCKELTRLSRESLPWRSVMDGPQRVCDDPCRDAWQRLRVKQEVVPDGVFLLVHVDDMRYEMVPDKEMY